jgi:hypothetical protein
VRAAPVPVPSGQDAGGSDAVEEEDDTQDLKGLAASIFTLLFSLPALGETHTHTHIHTHTHTHTDTEGEEDGEWERYMQRHR